MLVLEEMALPSLGTQISPDDGEPAGESHLFVISGVFQKEADLDDLER